ncbi:MAG TPA: DEAD/DEAH box helicase [Armatimonadota bacterium]|jgi:SNF2 family DNA or RNA helicase
MSEEWWRQDDAPASPGVLSRWLAPAAPPPIPATLLHVPTPVLREQALSVLLPSNPPASTTACRRQLVSDQPVTRWGYVKRWRARSVDLRHLLYPPMPTTGEADSPPSGKAEGVAEAISLSRLKHEELARRLLVALQPPPEVLLRVAGPLPWAAPFFPYQQVGVQALLRAPALLLGDEMGLGKTVQVIAALRILCYRREVSRALIVVPASVLLQWQEELARWAPDLRVMCVYGAADDRRWQWQYAAHVTLTSYETLRADAGSPLRGPRSIPWDLVVLDEAQKIKNREAALAQVCKRLPRRRAWALTGTPLENRTEDVASILEFVTGAPMPSDGPALHAALNQFQVRRRKVDVLADLPPKLVTDLTLPMLPAQRRAYDRAAQEGIVALREMGDVRIEHVLALITRLKQLCNFAPHAASTKLEDLRQRLDELVAEGHQALVFTQFTDDTYGAQRIAAELSRFAPLVYTGDLPLRERRDLITRFQRDDHGVLILSLRAGGQGLNLQCASYVFHFDRWWNPAVERQAEDRTHRIGQTLPVHVYRYLLADTIEQRIHHLLQQKTALFTSIVDTASLDLSHLLTQHDLLDLLGLDIDGA